MGIAIVVIGIALLLLYFWDLRKEKFTTRKIVLIGLFAAISIVLYMIPFIKYPQGGGITFFSMLPVMLLGVIYGRREALTCGLIFGFLKIIGGGGIINPAEFLLDYTLSTMVIGLSGMFGTDKKWKIFFGMYSSWLYSSRFKYFIRSFILCTIYSKRNEYLGLFNSI